MIEANHFLLKKKERKNPDYKNDKNSKFPELRPQPGPTRKEELSPYLFFFSKFLVWQNSKVCETRKNP